MSQPPYHVLPLDNQQRRRSFDQLGVTSRLGSVVRRSFLTVSRALLAVGRVLLAQKPSIVNGTYLMLPVLILLLLRSLLLSLRLSLLLTSILLGLVTSLTLVALLGMISRLTLIALLSLLLSLLRSLLLSLLLSLLPVGTLRQIMENRGCAGPVRRLSVRSLLLGRGWGWSHWSITVPLPLGLGLSLRPGGIVKREPTRRRLRLSGNGWTRCLLSS